MTSKLALFDQTLSASLLQPINSDHDYKAYKTKVQLKILEQRSESGGEKELKFELSRADDFEFLFAETLNNEKYQVLAREHDLTVDFDTFPKVIIQHLLCKNIVNNLDDDGGVDARKKPGYHSIIDHGRPTEINIILEKEKSQCVFEIFSKTPISKGKIFAMTLWAVRGDHLISHLLKICSFQSAKLSTFNKTSDELEVLRKKCEDLESENGKLEESLKEFEELSDRIRDLEDELALEKEEKGNVVALAEEKDLRISQLEEDVDSMNRELDDNQEELDIVGKMLREEQGKVDQLQKRNSLHQKEIGKLRAENSLLQRNFEKADGLLKKNDLQQNQQSLDIRKLRELEADLKEKDSMVENLTGTIGLLRKELEDEKLKLKEVMDSFERLKVENEGVKERLSMYRTQRYSPAPAGLTVPTVGYKPVLGQNSPYTNPNMRTPFRDATTTASNFQNMNITPLPHAARFNQLADDTTGSTMTNTPPVMRNPL
ncbi:hypothetical protein CRE_07133 [Caenorhabditis remanei]|uniref:Uncharacterized protein n=1 Tax=Caenorhabditis remanei TaxID=31234 RepID=E3NQ32_CAERE|nr:hypothetical protein CRE_07133 [Caenorhabditis remanei]